MPTDATRAELEAVEPYWEAQLAILVVLFLYLTLPDELSAGPRWLMPGLELALLVGLAVSTPYRHTAESQWRRAGAIAIIALVSLANVAALAQLVDVLLNGSHTPGRDLTFAAATIWLTNVAIFGLWLWELDAGGPGRRAARGDAPLDLLFPQQATPEIAPPGWRPRFADYLYVSFTNASAFSPTDTMPLTVRAKMLMLVEALAALVTIAVVAARAVNILS